MLCELAIFLVKVDEFFSYYILITDFQWPTLDFGWSLADVLKKNQELQSHKKKDDGQNGDDFADESKSKKKQKKKKLSFDQSSKSGLDMEIGTWSNEMALDPPTPDESEVYEIDTFDPNDALPDNLMILDGGANCDDVKGELGSDWGTGLSERRMVPRKSRPVEDGGDSVVRVGSPSNFETDGWDAFGNSDSNYGGPGMNFGHFNPFDDFDGDECESEGDSELDDKVDDEKWDEETRRRSLGIEGTCSEDEFEIDWPGMDDEFVDKMNDSFEELYENRKSEILDSDCYVFEDEEFKLVKAHRINGGEPQAVSEIKVKDKEAVPYDSSRTTYFGCDTWQGCDKSTNSTSKDLIVNREATLNYVSSASAHVNHSLVDSKSILNEFSFDKQPDLLTHPGPPPSVILQALTMSNANDGVNLERLETIGDSYLKYAITTYLYCTYPLRHEGKLSYLRSKQVSNLNLYRLGKRKGLGECMVATKFEPHDNWLPPGYFVPRELEEALIDSGVPAGHWNMADLPGLHDLPSEEIRRLVQERSEQIKQSKAEILPKEFSGIQNAHELPIFIPYNLLTQHSIPDKSIADCVEALIGAYLTTCGPRGALLFMSWLGIRVLPGTTETNENGQDVITYHQLDPPQSPLKSCPIENAEEQLTKLLSGYDVFEEKIGYKFRDQSYLLQAFTHASYTYNRLTDCYQRLEFLGDAVLGKFIW